MFTYFVLGVHLKVCCLLCSMIMRNFAFDLKFKLCWCSVSWKLDCENQKKKKWLADLKNTTAELASFVILSPNPGFFPQRKAFSCSDKFSLSRNTFLRAPYWHGLKVSNLTNCWKSWNFFFVFLQHLIGPKTWIKYLIYFFEGPPSSWFLNNNFLGVHQKDTFLPPCFSWKTSWMCCSWILQILLSAPVLWSLFLLCKHCLTDNWVHTFLCKIFKHHLRKASSSLIHWVYSMCTKNSVLGAFSVSSHVDCLIEMKLSIKPLSSQLWIPSTCTWYWKIRTMYFVIRHAFLCQDWFWHEFEQMELHASFPCAIKCCFRASK